MRAEEFKFEVPDEAELVIGLPWGSAALPEGMAEAEISLTLLQQSIITDLQRQRLELQEELDGIKIWFSSSKEANQGLRTKLAALQEQLAQQNVAPDPQTEQALEQAKADNARLAGQVQELTCQIAELSTQQVECQSAQQSKEIERAAEIERLRAELVAESNKYQELRSVTTEMSQQDSVQRQMIADLRGELNEAHIVLEKQRETIELQKVITDKSVQIANESEEREQSAQALVLSLTAQVKREMEEKTMIALAMQAYSLDPIFKIEGKGQLHLLELNDHGVLGDMKKMLGHIDALWLWIEPNGYGHPVGLTANGDLVTGEKSATYFQRRIGKAAREQLIDAMLRFNRAYYNELIMLARDTYALVAIRCTSLSEDVIDYIRGLELLPTKHMEKEQLDRMTVNLVNIHRSTKKAAERFKAKFSFGDTNKVRGALSAATNAGKPRKATKAAKSKRKRK